MTSDRGEVIVEAVDLPGRRHQDLSYENIHVGLRDRTWAQRPTVDPRHPWGVRDLGPGDAPRATWTLEFAVNEVNGELDFGGHFVRGNRGDRHIGLAWGEMPDATFRLFRGAKMRLDAIDRDIVSSAMRPGRRLVARLGLTDEKGHPRCATVRPPTVTWSTEAA